MSSFESEQPVSAPPFFRLPLGVLALASGLLVSQFGCVGNVASDPSNPGTAGSGGRGANPGPGGSGSVTGTGGGGGGVVVPPVSACNGTISPGRSFIRRLNGGEYDATLRDLVLATKFYSSTFPPDEQGATGGFSNNAASLVVSELLAEGYQRAAEEQAAGALAGLDKLAPTCNRTSMGDAACAKSFIQAFGKKAFRRPLATDEVTRYQNVYTQGSTGATYNDGISLVIEAMLQSPHFLYRVEIGTTPAAGATVAPLNQYELASRLSYFVWRSMPDATLFTAADNNQLSSVDQIKAQVDRMMTAPDDKNRARLMVTAFHREWLHSTKVLSAPKAATLYPNFTGTLKEDLVREADAFIEDVFWNSGSLKTLLTASYSFMNANVAKHYGINSVTGTNFVKTNMDPTQRSGYLTLAGFLAGEAGSDQSSPIHRGKFVREQLLCQVVPDPPADLMIKVPDVTPGTTTRQRFEAHDMVEGCKNCHQYMDPLGYAFESFDAVGLWRTQDQGIAVDTKGQITLADAATNGPYDGAVDMANRLANSATVGNCVATMWFRWGIGRQEDTLSAAKEDACSVETVQKQFQASGYDMRTLPVAVASTDAFRYIKAGGAQ
jgi:hypothetical protein